MSDKKQIKPQNRRRIIFCFIFLIALLTSYSHAAEKQNASINAQKEKQTTKLDANELNDKIQIYEKNNTVLDERLRELEASQKTLHVAWLEGQRKTIDWWLSFLGIMLAGLALLGALVPYLMGRKDRELIDLVVREARDAAEKAREHTKVAEALAREATTHVEIARTSASEAARIRGTVLSQEPTTSEKVEVESAAKAVRQDPQAPLDDKIRALAIDAGATDDSEKAYRLWAAASSLEKRDAVAAFNSGFWAHRVARKSEKISKRFWLQQAAQHYADALSIDPTLHSALNNSGTALREEANLIAGTDFSEAERLWEKSEDLYKKTLEIEPRKAEAIANMGNLYSNMAKVIVGQDKDRAQKLWKDAHAKYDLAVKIKPDFYEAYRNWGLILAEEAEAVAPSNLEKARDLWTEADSKFEYIASNAPKMTEAIENWAGILLRRRAALKRLGASEAAEVLTRAKSMLQTLVESGNSNTSAYNLGCCYALLGDAQSAIKWFQHSKDKNRLPSKSHIEADPDLDLIREDPSFKAWLSALDA